jgi:hypothetical protein
MKSPFPGMDPYIEASGLWPDFHDDLIGEIKRSLAAALPERYFVRTGERSYVVLADEQGKEAHPFIPDAAVRSPDAAPAGKPSGVATAVAGSATASGAVEMLAFVDERYRENFIEIYEAGPEERLVTCVEVLSPSNKRPNTEGWDLYLRKRQALLLGAANLVEIDLLRGGRRMPMRTAWPNSPYYVLLCRRRRAPYCTALPAGFRERLPVVRVPLDDPDPDVFLDLQPMVEAIYARSRYGRSIDYSRALAPPLGAEDAAWLAGQIQARQGGARDG